VSGRLRVLVCSATDKALLGFGERAVVTAMRAPTGDFRDWDAVAAWADAIAVELLRDTAVPSGRG
jgi:hypothetical protein